MCKKQMKKTANRRVSFLALIFLLLAIVLLPFPIRTRTRYQAINPHTEEKFTAELTYWDYQYLIREDQLKGSIEISFADDSKRIFDADIDTPFYSLAADTENEEIMHTIAISEGVLQSVSGAIKPGLAAYDLYLTEDRSGLMMRSAMVEADSEVIIVGLSTETAPASDDFDALATHFSEYLEAVGRLSP